MATLLTASSFQEAWDLIPRNDGVQFVGVWITPAASINQTFQAELTSGQFFYLDYPDQLKFTATLKYGEQYFYGYSDLPAKALLNAIFSYQESDISPKG